MCQLLKTRQNVNVCMNTFDLKKKKKQAIISYNIQKGMLFKSCISEQKNYRLCSVSKMKCKCINFSVNKNAIIVFQKTVHVKKKQ